MKPIRQLNGGIIINGMVLVFKTNLFAQVEYHVRALLHTYKQISAIDFDFEDIDNILRIEASEDLTSEIETLLNSNEILCEELV